MKDPADFVDDENWRGGCYEIAIDLGESASIESDARLAAALAAIWNCEYLDGPYMDRWTDKSDQEVLATASLDLLEPPPMYGVATFRDGRAVTCSSHVVREMERPNRLAHDWLDLCFPLGALGRIDGRVRGYPFDEDGTSIAWRSPIDQFFIDTARRVAAATSFRLALIGFEVSAAPDTESFDGIPPEDRWTTYVIPEADDITVFHANRTQYGLA